MSLEELRDEIDRVNREIVEKIEERMDIVDSIAEYKDENGIDTVDGDREEEVVQQFRRLFSRRDLPGERGEELAEFLIRLAVDRQES